MRTGLGVSSLVGALPAIVADGPPAPTQALAALMAAGGLALVVGVVTPLAAAAVGVMTTAAFVLPSGALPLDAAVAPHLIAFAVGILLLGPGGYSADARLFGRREIVVSHEPRR